MLPAVNRLRKSSEFTEVTRYGRRSTFGTVIAYVLLTDSSAAPKAGLIVGRQVGGSVSRHRVSRVLRSAVRLELESLPDGSMVVLRALADSAANKDLVAQAGAAMRAAVSKAAGQ